jgi:hypothetical protein
MAGVRRGLRRNLGSLKPSPAPEAVPATEFIATERKFTEVRIFARLLAELDAPNDASPCRNVRHNDRRFGDA